MKKKKNKKASERKSQWNALSLKLRNEKKCCEKCGGTKHLCVHHVAYKRQYPDLYFDERNLIVLDSSCHFVAHKDPTGFLAWFQEKFPDRWSWIKNFILTFRKDKEKSE